MPQVLNTKALVTSLSANLTSRGRTASSPNTSSANPVLPSLREASLQTPTWPARVRSQRASSRPPQASVIWSEARPSSRRIDLSNASILVLAKYFASRSATLYAALHFKRVAYRLLTQPLRHRYCIATSLHLPPSSAPLRHGLGYLAVALADHPQGHLRVGAHGIRAERLAGCEYARVVLRLSDRR